MTAAKLRPVTLGDSVTFTDHLVRHVEYRESAVGRREATLKVWKPYSKVYYREDVAPRRGVIVGVRTLANGQRDYLGYDEGIAFIPEEHIRAYLVAYDLTRKPVYVLEEHVVEWAANPLPLCRAAE